MCVLVSVGHEAGASHLVVMGVCVYVLVLCHSTLLAVSAQIEGGVGTIGQLPTMLQALGIVLCDFQSSQFCHQEKPSLAQAFWNTGLSLGVVSQAAQCLRCLDRSKKGTSPVARASHEV